MTDKKQKGFAADRIDRAGKYAKVQAGRKVYYRLDDLVEWMHTRGGEGRQ